MERNETWQYFRKLEQSTMNSESSIVICAEKRAMTRCGNESMVVQEEGAWRASVGSPLFERSGIWTTWMRLLSVGEDSVGSADRKPSAVE